MVKVFHGSPMVDSELNTYIQSTTGWVYSLDRTGRLRWEVKVGASPSNLALLDGRAFVAVSDSTVVALDMSTGQSLWRSKVAKGAPSDTHSLVAHGDTVITACNPVVHFTDQMNEAVCALNTHNGSLRWVYDMVNLDQGRAGLACNQVHAIVNGTVVFADSWGGLYRVSLASGEEIWYEPNITSLEVITRLGGLVPWGTTATMVLGPNEVIYHGFNILPKVGILRAHHLSNGSEMWRRTFQDEVNAAPAVGPLRPGGDLAVVVAVGSNVLPLPLHRLALLPVVALTLLACGCGVCCCGCCTCSDLWRGRCCLNVAILLVGAFLVLKIAWIFMPKAQGVVVALDAQSGEEIWRFDTGERLGVVAGSSFLDMCIPDIWGNPAIGADGSVYVNWSGGKAFALRDLDQDGVVSPSDPDEVSSYRHGFGSNGITAIAPGLMVAPSCRHLIGWTW